MQCTLSKVVKFEGKGLHTGLFVHMEIHPASINHGIVFRRVDLPGEPEVPAVAEYTVSTQRGTTIGKGDAQVSTIEHIMATLFALGIDNALIKIDGPEVPIIDGSALGFANRLSESGLEKQNAPSNYYTPERTIYYKDD
ncbi:MAG TPA: UDP-3-O-acyl-N-acetylglucosamine deacetylase, partial [Bacteroidales bacterium]|nr:UDP-3-O-acyl-N-acetylglucosamine deacetylase [Bacteroidales bacterium]